MRYALCAIVRDEADRIGGFLDSAMRYCGAATICDTGSQDGTLDILRARAEADPRISVSERPFDNFGAARSDAFAKSRGTASWILALDADMTIEVEDGWTPDPAVDAYTVRMGNGGDFEYRLPLLLRGDLPWQSTGYVHEYTHLPDRPYISANTDKVRVSYPDRSSPAKTEWQLGLLMAELAEQPDNARSVFYAAQCLRELGRNDEAREMYRRRITMGGFDQEVFYASYRAALLDPWPERAASLMAAWEMRPARLEPLHSLLTDLNSRGLHHAAYRLSQVSVEPCGDTLFVHTEAWRWGVRFERSISAWWCGDRAEAYRLMDELLADPKLPPHIRAATERNRAL